MSEPFTIYRCPTCKRVFDSNVNDGAHYNAHGLCSDRHLVKLRVFPEDLMLDQAWDTLTALEELRRVTNVDEWSEGHPHAVAYANAWDILGEERYERAMEEVIDPGRYVLVEDLLTETPEGADLAAVRQALRKLDVSDEDLGLPKGWDK